MVKYGVLVISHGSRNEDWVALVDEAVADLNKEGILTGIMKRKALTALHDEFPICSAFLEIVAGRLIQDGINCLQEQGVTDMIVVPLFISSGSTHIDEIKYALGVIPEPNVATDMVPFSIEARVHLCSPIDDDADIAEIIYEKIKDLSIEPNREIVLLVGHGSKEKGFHLRWRRGLERLADRIKQLGGFHYVDIAMLLPDQTKRKMEQWAVLKPGYPVVVAPLFLSEGYFTNEVIPKRLREYAYRYNGRTMLPHPLISRWMEKQIRFQLRMLEGNGMMGE